MVVTNNDVAALNTLMRTSTGDEAPVPTRKLRNNIENVEIFHSTRKTEITLCILGMWTIDMPPYGLARLIGITRAAGYKTNVYDFNVETYNYMKVSSQHLNKAWENANYWMWEGQRFYDIIFPEYKDYLDDYVERLIDDNPDVIGFSYYISNHAATDYVGKAIKEQRPDITIILGGPECHGERFTPPDYCDFYFVGESEGNILDFLENYENGKLPEQKRIGTLFGQKRINLDTLPFPDYTDFPLEYYKSKGAVTTEFSRGCVARCAYCTEVYFWKFRDRDAESTVDELEHMYNKYGVRWILFADSLMNGNMKEFRRFVELLAERKLEHLKWFGYARADARMDDDFYKLMKESGGQGFNYGFETGSDKVLLGVNKKNTVAEINANIESSYKHGLAVNACWVIGAPEEDIEAWAHSLNLIWNYKHAILSISPGIGLGDSRGSLYDDRVKYNISDRAVNWQGKWWTLDMQNTAINRFLRTKMIHMWIHYCNANDKNQVINNWLLAEDMSKHYTVKHHSDFNNKNAPYEFDFDYNIIKSGLGDFADTLMNEIFAFLRLAWRARGAQEVKITFNPELDNVDFENAIAGTNMEWHADIDFKIDANGVWQAHHKYKFVDNEKRRCLTGRANEDGEYEYTDVDESFEYEYVGDGKWD